MTKVVMTGVGQIEVKAHKKVSFLVNLTAKRMLEINQDEFPKLVSTAVFGSEGFELEKYEALRVNDDKTIAVEIIGNIKQLVKDGKVNIIDAPILSL